MKKITELLLGYVFNRCKMPFCKNLTVLLKCTRQNSARAFGAINCNSSKLTSTVLIAYSPQVK